MQNATIIKTFGDTDYIYTATAPTADEAIILACIYASMVEYGESASEWIPDGDIPFPEEQLHLYIQPQLLINIKATYANVVEVAYMNALGYVKSYIGSMFDVDAMLDVTNTTATSQTLRMALVAYTAKFVLSSSSQYSDVIECIEKNAQALLKGLRSGSRNMGKEGIIDEPDVRFFTKTLRTSQNRP